ncbi:MAG: phospholipase D family protein [Burkholderiaceae bacterium]|jgi:phosphatidylserine/phosphatidylglycerophosphate/cardiolipin synthase-like enzyme
MQKLLLLCRACARLHRALVVSALLAAALSGCAALPAHPERAVSSAISDYTSTTLYRITEPVVPGDGRSSFRLLPFASSAYATRIALSDLAQKSLDIQYYYFPGDNSGKFLMRALRNASERGVRVRVLIDDLYTSGEDPLLTSLAAFPNVEIRLFNPFPNFRDSLYLRFLGSVGQWGRVNHRMHNKLFIADNVAAVAGGRNMADEYFMRSQSNNFVDVDAFVAGPLVRDLSTIFDRYWNSEFAYPLASIVRPDVGREAAQRRFDELTIYTVAPPADEVTPETRRYATLPDELKAQHLDGAVPARARAFADPLSKVTGANLKSIEGTVTDQVMHLIDSAQENVTLISPYFVPGERGMELIRRAHARGVDQVVVTNSLASTDAPVVHGGYIRYRIEMLRAGVEIRELSPTIVAKREHFGRFGSSFGALHAKLAVVDHDRFFLGSMNLDERSEFENTELGLIVESPELAAQLIDRTDPRSSYTLRLTPDGAGIEWVEDDGKSEVVYHSEPEASFWLRLEVRLLQPVIPERDL